MMDRESSLYLHHLHDALRIKLPGTFAHSQRMAGMVDLLHPVDKLDMGFLSRCCLYHDIGKMMWPRESWEGADSAPPDYALHPTYAYDLLEDADMKVANVALMHHVFTKNPYPKIGTPASEECALTALVLSVLDVIDAGTIRAGNPMDGTYVFEVIHNKSHHEPAHRRGVLREVFDGVRFVGGEIQ